MSDKPITRERVLRILDGQAQKTANVIAGLEATAFDEPARDDGWTAKEILAHVASGYEGLLALARGQAPWGLEFETFDLDAHNEMQRERAQAMPLADVLAAEGRLISRGGRGPRNKKRFPLLRTTEGSRVSDEIIRERI